MANIADYYPESEYTGINTLFGTSFTGRGQSFGGNGEILQYVDFYLYRTGSTTGSAYAHIYAHSGTYGTSSKLTGSPLATSDAFDVSTLPTSIALVRLNFSGANKITLTGSVAYVLTLEYTNDGSTFLRVGQDSSGGHSGNESYKQSGAWNAVSTSDLIFYVYTDAAAVNGSNRLLVGVGK